MSQVIVEPHYLGSLEYYCLLLQHESIVLEVNDKFQKQTFRNRCQILGSNKILPLIVPVSYSNNSITKDVTIDHTQRWVKDHWGAFYSSYGKAPFFEYFADSMMEVWKNEFKYLVDLTVEFLRLTFRMLQMDVKMTLSENFVSNHVNDFRNVIIPKKTFADRKIYQGTPYSQLFGDIFNPNLSIIDLIMCEGPQASGILAASFLKQ